MTVLCAFLILTLPIPSHRHPLFLPFCREYFLPVHCSLLRTTTSASIYPSCICIPSQSKAHLMTSANTGPIKGSRRPSDRSVLPYQGCQGEPRLERVEIVIAISKVVGLQDDKIRLSQRLKFIEVFLFIYSTTMERFEVRPGVICISMLLRSRARARSNLGHAKN